MKPVSLVLGFGLLAVIGVACQPVAVPQPPVGPPIAAVPPICQAKGITSASDFVSQRAFLLPAASNYDPRTGTQPSGPNVDGQLPYSADLAAAFDAAPSSLQAMLCDRDYNVFIVQNPCPATGCTPDDVIANSWGFRQQVSPPNRYIATSAGLWQSGSLPPFATYEGVRLQAGLRRLDNNAKKWTNPPQFAQASPSPPVMSLLAVLAHEAGHVLWYDAFVSPPGGSFNASNFCAGSFYPRPPSAGSWSSINIPHLNDIPRRWINFGERIANEVHNPDHAGLIQTELSGGNFAGAGNRLFALFQDPGLADVLAAFSPDEDFVETYEWYVLTNAKSPLSDLRVQITGHPDYNIPGGLPSKGPLQAKIACLRQYIQSQSWPLP